jgi:hypothetical protein
VNDLLLAWFAISLRSASAQPAASSFIAAARPLGGGRDSASAVSALVIRRASAAVSPAPVVVASTDFERVRALTRRWLLSVYHTGRLAAMAFSSSSPFVSPPPEAMGLAQAF